MENISHIKTKIAGVLMSSRRNFVSLLETLKSCNEMSWVLTEIDKNIHKQNRRCSYAQTLSVDKTMNKTVLCHFRIPKKNCINFSSFRRESDKSGTISKQILWIYFSWDTIFCGLWGYDYVNHRF